MTTIVAVKGKMLADSKVSIGRGYSYPTTKIVKTHNRLVGAAGHAGDCSRFLEWANDDFRAKARPKFVAENTEDAIDGLIVQEDGIYFFAPSFPGPEKINSDFYAIGSGGKAARAAMHAGASPEEAIEIACRVDDYSGPPIIILELDKKEKKDNEAKITSDEAR